MIADLVQADAIPALESMMRFSAGRQRILAHNIANISTPDYQPVDVSIEAFQDVLGDAIDKRRAKTGGHRGALEIRKTEEVQFAADGRIRLNPRSNRGGVLQHDRNNRDLERLMQDVAENVGAFRVASDLLRSRYQLLNKAISERVL